MKRNVLIALLPVLMLLTSCGTSDGGFIAPPTFKTVSSYDRIPNDFTLLYDIRDEYASPPYRMVVAVGYSGTLTLELYEEVGSSMDKTFENSVMSHDDVLDLYNFAISNGYFHMDELYTTDDLSTPVESIEIYAKSTDIRVEHHACPFDDNEPPLPPEFRTIIDKFLDLASDYLENV